MSKIEADLEDIVRTIWQTLLGLPVEPGRHGELGPDSTVTGIVHIDGAWHGAVLLQCPGRLAATLASAMFQSGDTPGRDEVRDALGELTNMVAGNAKALLPEPSAISLPVVAFGSDYEIDVVGTVVVARVPLVCDGLPLAVTLVQRSGDDNESSG